MNSEENYLNKSPLSQISKLLHKELINMLSEEIVANNNKKIIIITFQPFKHSFCIINVRQINIATMVPLI